MSDFITPLSPEYSIAVPQGLMTWLAYGLWFGLILLAAAFLRDRKVFYNRQSITWLAILTALVLIVTPFMGMTLITTSPEPTSSLPIHHLMFFAAVPWMVGAGVVGLVPAVVMAGMSGLLLAYMDTHHLATPFLFMTAVLLYFWALRHNRQSALPQFLSFPAAGAAFAWLLSSVGVFFSLILTASGPFGLRFGAAINAFPLVFLSFGGMIIIGGFAGTLIRLISPRVWAVDQGTHQTRLSKYQSGLQAEDQTARRLLVHLVLAFLLLASILVGSIWLSTEDTVRQMLVEHLTNSTSVAAEGISGLIEPGIAQIEDLANERMLLAERPVVIAENLAQLSASQSLFDQLGMVSQDGAVIANTPSAQEGSLVLSAEETLALEKMAGGSSPYSIIIPGQMDAQTADLSFLVPIANLDGSRSVFLLGRISPDENPMADLFLDALDELESNGGIAQIIDGQGLRLYHTDPGLILTDYTQRRFPTATFFESTSWDNQPLMMYYQPAGNSGLSVIMAFPAAARYQAAWEMAFPALLTGVVLLLILLMMVFFWISPLMRENHRLKSGIHGAVKAHFLSERFWEKSKNVNYEDVFSQTLDALTRRNQQQRDLLRLVGPKSLSTNLEVDLAPVMKAALAQGVSSVRVILNREALAASDRSNHGPFGLGQETSRLAALDGQVSSLVDEAGVLILKKDQIPARITLPNGLPTPALLAAFPLTSAVKNFGVLWVAYSEKQDPGHGAADFFSMLSERASDVLNTYALIAELKLQQFSLAETLNLFPQAVLIADEKKIILYHNRRVSELFDAPDELIDGMGLQEFFSKRHLKAVLGLLEKMDGEEEIRLDSGLTLNARIQPVVIHEKTVGSVLIFEPLGAFTKKMESSSELVTVVSHALRSPLTLIHGYAKILRLTGNLNDQQDDYILKITKGIEEIRSLVQNLLDIRRLESQGLVKISEFQASQVLHQIRNSMAAQFRQKNVQFSTSLPEKPLMIRADFDLLTLAIRNLVDNALKSTKMGGEVSISVEDRNERVSFAVKDTGAGISPLDQRHLFDKFQPGHITGNGDTAGSGLGLMIVRSIIEHHGGRVWVESQLGKGSTFTVEIPKKRT